jgi:LacI family transcriptional regulator
MKERAISIAAVAKRAGVSIATVSRVVNGVANKASPETVERVRRAVQDLGWRPMSAGRSLRRLDSRLVALIAANLSNPAMAAIAASAETALRREGLTMLLCDSHDRAELQDEYLLEMRSHMVRATVLLGAVASPRLDAMLAAGEPLVFVNRRCPGQPGRPFIGIDNRAAGRDVAGWFLDRGIRDVAVVHGHVVSSATVDRLAGIRDAFAAHGAPLADAAFHTLADAEHLEIGYRVAARLIEAGPVPAGIICASDMIAFGVHRRLSEAGLTGAQGPDLIGFDDNPLNAWIAPWLSSVRIPYEAFGDALVRTIGPNPPDHEGGVILPYELVDRRSGVRSKLA